MTTCLKRGSNDTDNDVITTTVNNDQLDVHVASKKIRVDNNTDTDINSLNNESTTEKIPNNNSNGTTTSTTTTTTSTTTNDSSTIKIKEGSCEMVYQQCQSNTVFYNPVQVQNRDLSIIMISMYIERRAKRIVQQNKRSLIRKDILHNKLHKDKVQQLQQNQQQQNQKGQKTLSQSHLEEIVIKEMVTEQVDEYMKTITGRRAIEMVQELDQQQNQKHSSTSTTTPTPLTGTGISILDALAASGLRSMRYWKEIPLGVHHITINDIETSAIERAYTNIIHNNLDNYLVHDRTSNGIRINQNDATTEMYNSRPIHRLLAQQPPLTIPNLNLNLQQKQQQQQQQQYAPYDVIDLDPYGSASPFLDAAVQGIADKGMLCVTCTDMIALGGSHPETAFGRYYGSMPIPHAKYLHEMAVRIVLYSIAMTAAKYGKVLYPILSVGMDFYVRVFVEIHIEKSLINDLAVNKIGYVYQSTQCPSFYIVPAGKKGGMKGCTYQPGRLPEHPTTTSTGCQHNTTKQQHIGQCEETGSTFKIGGPIWTGPMHDPIVLKDLLERFNLVTKFASNATTTAPAAAAVRPSKDEQDLIDVFQHITTTERLHGLVLSCYDETKVPNSPLFYNLHDLAQTLNVQPPSIKAFHAALINLGYTVAGYHKEPHSIKTNAPNYVIWDIMREWSKQHPPNLTSKKARKRQKNNNGTNSDHHNKADSSNTNVDDNNDNGGTQDPDNNNDDDKQRQYKSVAERILSQPSRTKDIDFTIRPSSSTVTPGTTATTDDIIKKNKGNRIKPVSRFPLNPQANWGPKAAAKGKRNQQQQPTMPASTPTTESDHKKDQN